MNEHEETITLDQLSEGLRDIGAIAGHFGSESNGRVMVRVDNPRGVAEAIFRRFREPEYEPGEVYQDANGDLYYLNYSLAWRECKSGMAVHDSILKRPLTKLVPEDG